MKMILTIIFSLSAAVAVAGVPLVAVGQTGQISDREQVMHDFFAGADSVDARVVDVTPELAAKLKGDLGYVPALPRYTVWVGKKAGAVLGYAIVDDEKGMHEPITFAVLVGTDGAVKQQQVLVYREPAGDGVTSSRFRSQFIGKTVKDPIKDGVDITIVSSATISSHSMAVGVKRAVAIVTEGVLHADGTTASSSPATTRHGG